MPPKRRRDSNIGNVSTNQSVRAQLNAIQSHLYMNYPFNQKQAKDITKEFQNYATAQGLELTIENVELFLPLSQVVVRMGGEGPSNQAAASPPPQAAASPPPQANDQLEPDIPLVMTPVQNEEPRFNMDFGEGIDGAQYVQGLEDIMGGEQASPAPSLYVPSPPRSRASSRAPSRAASPAPSQNAADYVQELIEEAAGPAENLRRPPRANWTLEEEAAAADYLLRQTMFQEGEYSRGKQAYRKTCADFLGYSFGMGQDVFLSDENFAYMNQQCKDAYGDDAFFKPTMCRGGLPYIAHCRKPQVLRSRNGQQFQKIVSEHAGKINPDWPDQEEVSAVYKRYKQALIAARVARGADPDKPKPTIQANLVPEVTDFLLANRLTVGLPPDVPRGNRKRRWNRS